MFTISSNEYRFKKILDKTNDIILTHVDGIITYINEEGARRIGYLEDEIIGQDVAKFVALDHREGIETAVDRRIAGDTDTRTYQVQIVAKDGSCIPVEVKSTLLNEFQGHNEFVVVASDVTERLINVKKQQHVEELLRIELDMAMKIAKTSDVNEILLICLESAMQASGMDAGGVYMVRQNGDIELIVSRGLSRQYIDKASYYPVDSRVSEIARRGQPIYTEATDTCDIFDDLTREEGLLSTASIPVKDEGKLIVILNLATRNRLDIPIETRNLLEIIASNIGSAIARAEYENFKQRFLSNTSHELKTPLTSICGAAEFLQMNIDPADPFTGRMISLIKRGSKRLQGLIDNILDFSRLESERITLNKETVDLVPIINNVINDMQCMADQRGQSITAQIPETLTGFVDKFRIEQVLVNLVSNAIKNTPEGGHVQVIGSISPDFITLAVKDDGVGITKEEMTMLFTKFGKIERKGINVDLQGTGLGLYISRGIVEMHGGRISVESAGRFMGSTFYVHLPAFQASD